MNKGNFVSITNKRFMIVRFIKPYWIVVTFILILLAADVLFDISVAFAQGYFIDSIQSGNPSELNRTTTLIIAIFIGFVFLLAVHRYLLVWLSKSVYKDMSVCLLKLINRKPYSFVQAQSPSDLVLRVKEDTKHSTDLIDAAAEFITVIFIITLSFSYLLKVDTVLAIIAILSAVAIFVSSRFFDNKIRKTSAEVEAREADVVHHVQEYMNGISVIKHFGASQWLIDRLDKYQKVLNQSRFRLAQTEDLSENTAMAVFNVTQLAALSIIAIAATRNTLTPGTIIACSLLFELVVWPILGLSRQWSRIQGGTGAMERVYDWMKGTPMKSHRECAEEMKVNTPVLEIKNADYTPDNCETVLKDINLQVSRGEVIAVVGPSGAGKSTFCKLVTGLYEPTNGEVRILGRSATECLMEATDRVTYISQNPTFFTGTVKENIVLNKEHVSNDALDQATIAAGFTCVLENLVEGYEAPIEERGSNLSGGEKQRLSLSRIFLRNSDLYILDEPTSSLDKQTEQEVMYNLLTFFEGKTAIIVTHKLDLARRAHRIVVISEGKIIESGTHEQLIERGHLYNEMWNNIA